ncbi:arg8-vasotocin receptor-like isoform X2 [Cebidichthys violaceus]|uniref:arg8-vasotocin receptor-like isoform X2 n=1 Tax=Cebidichthys violaceus TaxID=271503 RepID=UPI0035C9963B
MILSSTQFHPHKTKGTAVHEHPSLSRLQPELDHCSIKSPRDYIYIKPVSLPFGKSELFHDTNTMCPLNASDFAEDVARDESLAKLEIALLSVIFISATILNASLLLVLWRQRKQMSRMRVFVFHLCLADLVVAFFQVCPQLMWDITDRFVGPDLVCRLVKYLQVLGMFSSTYMIVVMTVDRYQAVCNPMVKFQRTMRICRAIQINLYQKTQQQGKVGLRLPSKASGVAGMSKARVKTLKMTVVIVLAYIVCWTPFFTVQLWSAWDTNAPKENATFTILMLLASLNSCANPCIYLLFSGQFPQRLVTLLWQRHPNGRDSIREEATLVSTLYMSFKNVSESK